MLQTTHRRTGLPMMIIHPGERFATKDNMVISTVLGSCISVVLFDARLHLGGMNHFMLPLKHNSFTSVEDESGRYGIFAMEFLINDLMKLGATRSSLRAKVFGGGHVLHHVHSRSHDPMHNIPEGNIKFAFEYLENEGIPVISSDVGGTLGRKVFYMTEENRVFLKRFHGNEASKAAEEDKAYLRRISRETPDSSNVQLF